MKKLLYFLILLQGILFATHVNGATYYWVGGSGNWCDTAHWSLTSGGSGGVTALPYTQDDVVFDANSFPVPACTVYVDITCWGNYDLCRNFDWSNVTNNPVFYANPPGAMYFSVYGDFLLSPNMTFAYTGTIHIVSAAPVLNIRTAGHPFDDANIYAGSSAVHLQDSLVGSDINVFMGAGSSFYTHSNDMRATSIKFQDGGTVYLENSILTAMGVHFQEVSVYGDSADIHLRYEPVSGLSGLELIQTPVVYLNEPDADTSAISFCYISGNNQVHFRKFQLDYLNISAQADVEIDTVDMGSFNLIDGDGTQQCAVHTFYAYNETWITAKMHVDNMMQVDSGGTIWINDTLFVDTLTLLNDAAHIGWIRGDRIATWTHPGVLSKTGGNYCTDNTRLSNISATGGASFYATSPVFNEGGNTGWEFQPCGFLSSSYYWVGGTGNWSDLSHWATTSGGTVHPTTLPDSITNVFFDVNSFPSPGAVVTIDVQISSCRDFDWSGAINNPVFTRDISLVADSLRIYGSFILNPGMAWDFSANTGPYASYVVFLSNAAGNIFDQAGVPFTGLVSVLFGASWTAGEWLLQSDFLHSGLYTYTQVKNGIFRTNGMTMQGYGFQFLAPSTSYFSNSTILCTNYNESGGAVSPGQSVINCLGFVATNSSNVYPEVNCSATAYCNTCEIETLRTPALSGFYGNVTNAYIGEDTTTTAQIFVNLFHIEKAICKGQNIILSKLVAAYAAGDYDTLLFDTPGSMVHLADTDTLFVNNRLLFNSLPGNAITFQSTSLNPANIFSNTDTICADYLQLQNLQTNGSAVFFAGANSTDLGGNTGWQFTSCTSFSDVWPGDANYDLVTNNQDILNIGIAFGTSGPLRPGASLAWVAQPAADWNDWFLNIENYKHADCDGSGIVDWTDTTAVNLNYSLTHPARFTSPPEEAASLLPELRLDISPDTLHPSDHLVIDISLGTAAIPVDSIYGIAFTLNMDPLVVDMDSVYADFTGSWLGTAGTDMIGFARPDPLSGKADFALCRTDHQNILGGYGHIVSCEVVIVDNISTITRCGFGISDVHAITYQEYQLALSRISDSVVVDPATVVNTIEQNPIRVYPNPVSSALYIYTPGAIPEAVELFDISGRPVLRTAVSEEKIRIDVSRLPAGVYQLRCLTKGGIIHKRIQVVK